MRRRNKRERQEALETFWTPTPLSLLQKADYHHHHQHDHSALPYSTQLLLTLENECFPVGGGGGDDGSEDDDGDSGTRVLQLCLDLRDIAPLSNDIDGYWLVAAAEANGKRQKDCQTFV